MRFLRVTIFSATALVIAKPIPNREAGGIAIPLTRHSLVLNSNESINLDAISSRGILVEEKILKGLDNHEMNTGTMHPFAVKRSESIERRGAIVPLTPGQSYTTGMWIAEISIGTPPKTLKVQIDTGTADMWVLETGCIGIKAAGNRNLWDPKSSTTAADNNRPFEREYEDGSFVEGDLYTDNVTIAGFTADSQTFGSITSYTSRIPNHGDADGLLGLAVGSPSQSGPAPLLASVSLVREAKLTKPIISFKLSSSGAEMYLGGANRMLYNGDITYTRVTRPGLWEVSMDDIRINGNKILENVNVVLDTGANYIYGDWKQVSEFYGHLGGILMKHKGSGYYILPCNSFPAVGFTFGGRTFEIPAEVFRLQPISKGSLDCFGVIMARRSHSGFWTVGSAFLQGVYSVFDYASAQVGFADLA